MSLIRIRVENESDFSTPSPVGVPTSEQIAVSRTAAHQTIPVGSSGVWECTKGRFRRGVAEAEYSYFISGEGSFTVDGEEPVEFRAGDAIYFPANTQGEWEIRQTVRKAYVIFT
ncbi:cupin domain-containing protein [Agrobacterium tumefaciens]|uniref:cupin domain-containing protein n=1 Tax=Agrobacterium tumefaciens TaxID=358 RepID=UPI001571C708|nr:cupin domain-containing protein [Agrobacterium tumefaciens]NSZ02070.1 cupin domain-containing protein [Agrobacterium tumefaciens]NTB05697.1 cupin domain-containing protein [Agrobacterium tumefaciens]NTB21796.1 cupin domain-containing protein [Agrobacterium tumefaciens]NTB29542.1 cupin domain-containing protein [Agrobacterium tumefaciens]NTB34522.1 cupin domain-containing protein [Agrobacterium tumefaciens]